MTRVSIMILALLAWGETAPAAWRDREPVLFALLVASNDGGDEAVRLRYAQRDAEKMRAVLTDLGNLRAENTIAVIGGDAEDVLGGMDEMRLRIGKAAGGSAPTMLIFYYSGHAKNGQLMLGDSRLELIRLKQWIEQVPADIRVAFIDTCQAGEITSIKGGGPAPSMVKLEHTRGQILVTSSSGNEGSQESDEIGGSFFTHYLASALRGAADQSADGKVSLKEAYEYTYNQTVNRTAGTRGGVQHPTYGYSVSGHGEIVLTHIAHPPCTIDFPAALSGSYLIYDLEKHVIVAELDKTRGQPASIAVSPGMFAVKKRRQHDLLLGEYSLESGQRLTVTDEDLGQVAFENDITKGLVTIREKTKYIGYSLRLGGETFFDAPTRDDLFYSSLQAGVQIEFFGVIGSWVSVALDVMFGGGHDATRVELENGTTQDVAADFFRAEVGAAMHFHLDWDWFGLYGGPRLSFLIASRQLGEPLLHWPTQTYSSLSPGISGGLVFHLGDFDLFLEGRIHYLYYNIGDNASLGYGGVYLGAAYRQ
ncbi:MAG TPA: caspase family protein [Myxococcota bacterium]|nr:caspase family protein [Myxococcota bacterium]